MKRDVATWPECGWLRTPPQGGLRFDTDNGQVDPGGKTSCGIEAAYPVQICLYIVCNDVKIAFFIKLWSQCCLLWDTTQVNLEREDGLSLL
jgi:hypothetical protein